MTEWQHVSTMNRRSPPSLPRVLHQSPIRRWNFAPGGGVRKNDTPTVHGPGQFHVQDEAAG
jgi:hypothetical protein